MGSPPRFLKLREPGTLSRAQDAIDTTLTPVAEALGNTPIMGARAPVWIQPDLLSGLVNFGGGNATAGYHKDALGYVWSKGTVSSAAGVGAGTQLFRLGAGYRPAATIIFPVWNSAGVAQAVSVDPDGYVYNQVAVGAAGWISLVFSFLSEQ